MPISATTISGGNWIIATPELAKLLGATYSYDKKAKTYKLAKKEQLFKSKPMTTLPSSMGKSNDERRT